MPALDGIRGIAILLVMASHLGWAPGGLLGVDVFFALSGFLITTLLLEERFANGGVDLRAFYMRRARRLLPGLVAMLLVVSIAYVMVGHWRHLVYPLAALLYVPNLVRVVSDHTFPHGLGHTWSLGEEEQFYFIWPAVLIWLLRARRPAMIARGLLGAALLVAVWRLASWQIFGFTAHTVESPDTRSDALLLGCAFAAARFAGVRLPRLSRGSGVLALVGIILIAVVVDRGPNAGVELMAALPAVAVLSVAVVAAAIEPGSWAARLLAVRPLSGLGVISYSVYLWHLPVYNVFLAAPEKIAAAVLVGLISYLWIEQPFRRRRRDSGMRGVAQTSLQPSE